MNQPKSNIENYLVNSTSGCRSAVSEWKSRNTAEGIQVSSEEFLKAKPLRNPGLKWEEDEKGVHVKIPRKRMLLPKFFPLTRERRFLLDKQGALVWSLCDGEHQIREIAKQLSGKYSMHKSDAEAALDLYLVQLSKNGLVSFVLPESVKKRYNKRRSRTQKATRKIR
jgi:hypothetical protein